MSKLYLLKRMDSVGYDEYDGFVVAADTETEARDFAAKESADEGAGVWNSQLDCSCTLLALSSKHSKGIVLGSFNAG